MVIGRYRIYKPIADKGGKQSATIQQIFNETVRAAISGKSREVVIQNLYQKGILAQTAESIASQAFKLKENIFRQQGLKYILGGIFMLVAGIAVSGLSYFLAGIFSRDSSFVVMGGAIVFGIIYIFNGLFKVMKN